jgi:RHS repeat-associated protein
VVVDALGDRTTTLFDAVGNVTQVTDARGNSTQFLFDAVNRQSVVVDAWGDRTTTLFDAVDNVTQVTDARGNSTQFLYDALNRQSVTVDALGNRTTTLFDAVGNVTQVTDARANSTQFLFDALNRQSVTVDAVGNRTTTLFDAVGNVTQITDPRGNSTQYQFDALERQTVIVDALGHRTTVLLDAVGNVTQVTDADNNTTEFSYDPLNRTVQQTDPFGKTTTFAYDAVGNMTSSTDRLGRIQNFVFDALDRVTGQTWISSGTTINTLTFTYDANSNLLTAANSNGTYTLSYDALNRVTVAAEPFGQTLTMSYDSVGNRTLLQDSHGGVTSSVYDADNNLTSLQFGGTGQTPLREDFTYNAVNEVATATRYSDLAGTHQVGASSYTYDAAERLSNQQDATGGGTVYANYTYTYDPAGNVQSEALNGATTSYSYDALNQMTSDGTNGFSYDPTGNRTGGSFQTGTANQLTNDGTWSYTYDAEGNLLKKTKGSNAETWTYGYDHQNHLLWAEDRQTDGGTLIRRIDYKYDAFGNRIEQDVTTGSTVVTRYALDGWGMSQDSQSNPTTPTGNENWNVWADLDGSSQLQTRYVRGDQTDQLLARVSAAGTAAWYISDLRGSVRNLTDASGTVQDTIAYDGYGNVTAESNASFGDRWKYTGREWDSSTGLYYERDRYYDPKTGRWTSQDRLGLAGPNPNLYGYAGNNPSSATDPSGDLERKIPTKTTDNVGVYVYIDLLPELKGNRKAKPPFPTYPGQPLKPQLPLLVDATVPKFELPNEEDPLYWWLWLRARRARRGLPPAPWQLPPSLDPYRNLYKDAPGLRQLLPLPIGYRPGVSAPSSWGTPAPDLLGHMPQINRHREDLSVRLWSPERTQQQINYRRMVLHDPLLKMAGGNPDVAMIMALNGVSDPITMQKYLESREFIMSGPTRFMALPRAVGSGLEATVGGLIFPANPVAGGLIGGHGALGVWASLVQMVTGQSQRTYTSQLMVSFRQGCNG